MKHSNNFSQKLFAVLIMVLSANFVFGQGYPEVAYLNGANGEFGVSISLNDDGTILAVGAKYANAFQGQVSIWENEAGEWNSTAFINEPTQNSFGYSVSLTGDGSRFIAGGPNDATGAAYLFGNGTGGWSQEYEYPGQSYSQTGKLVAISADGNVMAIYAPGSSYWGANGFIKIFKKSIGGWEEIHEFPGINLAQSLSMSADGSVVAFANWTANSYVGEAYVYENNDGVWELKLEASGLHSGESFGYSLSLSDDGTTLAVGARAFNPDNLSYAGRVRIYKDNAGTWEQLGSDIFGTEDFDQLGASVSLNEDGSILAIGAIQLYDDKSKSSLSGKAEVYQYNEGKSGKSWQQIAVINGGLEQGDAFGWSISISNDGSVVAVGANQDGNGQDGYVKIYEYDPDYCENTALNLSAVQLSSTSTQLSWNDEKSESWEVVHGEAGFDPEQASPVQVSNTNYTVSGLTPDQGYEFYVRNQCTNTNYSEWNGPQSFSTGLFAKMATFENEGGKQFGFDISLNGEGTKLAVSDNEYNDYEGQVTIWEYNGDDWSLTNEIYSPDEGEMFGNSIGLSNDGNILAVGMPEGDEAYAYIFSYDENDDEWDDDLSEDSPNGSYDFAYVTCISENGQLMAVSSEERVFFYEYNDGEWDDLDDLYLEEMDDISAMSLDYEGDIFVVGDSRYSGEGDYVGQIQIFRFDDGEWNLEYSDEGFQDNERFGSSVSLSDDGLVCVASAISYDIEDDDKFSVGRIRTYTYNDGDWQQAGSDLFGSESYDYFGSSLSLSEDGTTLAIGAIEYDDDKSKSEGKGRVDVYNYVNDDWELLGTVEGDAYGNTFGASVALSNDGTLLAVGATQLGNYDGGGKGSNGYVSIYVLNAVDCSAPTELSVDNVTETSADLSWSGSSPGGEFQIVLGPEGFNPADSTPVLTTDNPYSVTGLEEVKAYEFYVRGICGEGEYTDWAGPEMFVTTEDEYFIQVVPPNWSLVSTFLQPTDPEMEETLSHFGLDGSLTIVVSPEGIYWPIQNLNTIGNWNVERGYKIKMAQGDQLIFTGAYLPDNEITYNAGFYYMAVHSDQPSPVTDVFNDPENDVKLISDLAGGLVYWPDGGLYTLTTLQPGVGYLAIFNTQVTLTYPTYSNNAKGARIFKQEQAPKVGPWDYTRTSSFHSVSVRYDALANYEGYTHIGAFDEQGKCIGATEINTKQNFLLTLYGDDFTTGIKDGATENENISFKVYNSDIGQEMEVLAEFNTKMQVFTPNYMENGLSQIITFKERATNIFETNNTLAASLYPNPSSGNVYLKIIGLGAGELCTVDFYDTKGELVKHISHISESENLSVNDLERGVYILKISSNTSAINKKLIVE